MYLSVELEPFFFFFLSKSLESLTVVKCYPKLCFKYATDHDDDSGARRVRQKSSSAQFYSFGNEIGSSSKVIVSPLTAGVFALNSPYSTKRWPASISSSSRLYSLWKLGYPFPLERWQICVPENATRPRVEGVIFFHSPIEKRVRKCRLDTHFFRSPDRFRSRST